MVQRIFAAVGCIFFVIPVFGQFNETIRTGRPGQSIGAFTVGHGILQVQSGLDWFGYRNEGTGLLGRGGLSNTVVRFGLTEPFEVSALIEYRFEKQTTEGLRSPLSGWSALDVGMRYHIFTGKGLVPNVGFQIRWRIPGVGGDYSIDQWAPRFLLVSSQQITDKITFITNWGASWNGNSAVPQGNYTANLSYAITAKLGIFLENYGSVFRNDFDTYVDGGLAWLVNPDLQLDLLAGYGKNEGFEEYFISGGISVRTKRKSR